MPKVFIIILNWNGYKDTVACLDSLKNLDYPNYEIIVIDNGSTDDSTPQFKFLGGSDPPRFKLIENEKNLGFSGGNNVGIKYALENGAEYILLLNNDTIIEPSFLKELIKVGESNKEVGVLGPKILFAGEPNLIWSAGGKFSWFASRGINQRKYKETDSEEEKEPIEADYISGCALLIKREVIDKIGLLDNKFFLYYEDTDWNFRAKKAGFKVVYIPKAKIWHKVSLSVKKLSSPTVLYYDTRNRLLLIQKHALFPIKTLFYIWSFWFYLKQMIKRVLFPSKKEEAKLIQKAIGDFWRGKFGKIR